MPLEDYAHHNEEARQIWWLEEGQHQGYEELHEPDNDDFRFDDEGDSHHESEADCVRDGCFDLPSRTEQWECAICGRLHLGMNPRTEDQARRAGARHRVVSMTNRAYVPGWMLIELIGEYMQGQTIAGIEDMSGAQFLQLLKP